MTPTRWDNLGAKVPESHSPVTHLYGPCSHSPELRLKYVKRSLLMSHATVLSLVLQMTCHVTLNKSLFCT